MPTVYKNRARVDTKFNTSGENLAAGLWVRQKAVEASTQSGRLKAKRRAKLNDTYLGTAAILR
jgi:hypothetical protein